MEKNQAAAGTQTALADLIVPAGDANFDFFAGERGFYTIASLALGKILRTAPLRRAVDTQHSKEPFGKHAPSH